METNKLNELRDSKNLKPYWVELPFILLSKIYIHFYSEEKEFYLIFPSHILSFLLSLNIINIITIFYEVPLVWSLIFCHIILYFLIGFIYIKRFPAFNSLKNFKLTISQKIIAISLIVLLVFNFIILANYLKSR